MRSIKIVSAIFALILLFPSIILAHPGRTASDDCHYCRTNCDSWGVAWNQRHCHGRGWVQGVQEQQPIYIPPTNTPTPWPTWTLVPTKAPTPTNTPILTTTPTPIFTLTPSNTPTSTIAPTLKLENEKVNSIEDKKKIQVKEFSKKSFWLWLFEIFF